MWSVISVNTFSSDHAPLVAFLHSTYEAAAGPVNQKRPLSASGSLQLFRLTVADAPV